MTARTLTISLVTRFNLLAARLGAVAALLTRLVIGESFILTGFGKLTHFERTVGFFTSIGIPVPAANAAFIGGLELVGGVALLVGFGTRIFSGLLASTMVVALITADRMRFVEALPPGAETGLTDVVPVVFLLFLLWLVANGAGAASIDAALARRRSTAPIAA